MSVNGLVFQARLDALAETMTRLSIDIEACIIAEPFGEYSDLYPELFDVMIGDYHEALKAVADMSDRNAIFSYMKSRALAVDVLRWHYRECKERATENEEVMRVLERLGKFIELPKLNESDGSIAYKGEVYPRIKSA